MKRRIDSVQSLDVATFGDNVLIRVSFPPPGFILLRGSLLVSNKRSSRHLKKALPPGHRYISRVQVLSMPPGPPQDAFSSIPANEASQLLVCRGEHLNDPLLWKSEAALASFRRMGVTEPGDFKTGLRQLLVEQGLWKRKD